MRRCAAAVVVLLLAVALVGAEDKKEKTENTVEGVGVLDSQQLKISNGRLTWSVTAGKNDRVTIYADYSLTKDSLLYAVVTKMDLSSVSDDKLKEQLPSVDDTFSFRFRADDGELNVRDVKGKGFDQFKSAAGRYKQSKK